MDIEYHTNNTRVHNGYKYSSTEIKKLVKDIIQKRKELGLPVTRTESSYIHEWKAHNRLYKLGVERDRTKDVDLEEPIDAVLDALYSIVGM